ncbi:MAG TPA: signal peptidase II [Hyphomicrobiales bacterium]|nr:signal peptidase II [Hyphomicrobiales bacterium]
MNADGGRLDRYVRPLSTRVLLFLAALLVIGDQASKWLADTYLTYAEPHAVLPGFDLLLAYNRGAAFSFLHTADGWQRWILSGISLGVSAFLLVWLHRLPSRQSFLRLAVALVLGGAVGNLVDRVVLGHVIDFISIYAHDWRFATFNLADAAISVGAVLLALDVFCNQQGQSQHE